MNKKKPTKTRGAYVYVGAVEISPNYGECVCIGGAKYGPACIAYKLNISLNLLAS